MTRLLPAGRRPASVLIPMLAVVLLSTSACSGDQADKGPTTAEVLADAKQQLDDTSGVDVALTTEELPSGVDGVLKAVGTGTHAPAFEGNVTVLVNSLSVDVPLVAVGGTVYAKLPFTSKYAEIDPEDYGAPDPASMLAPGAGISSWLTDAEKVEQGDRTRDGDQVLTTYTGTLPGESVATVIPSADKDADFDATFRIDQDGRLHSAEVVGPFYAGQADVDYTIELSAYGTQKDITKP
jgi:lipoprotein LprG